MNLFLFVYYFILLVVTIQVLARIIHPKKFRFNYLTYRKLLKDKNKDMMDIMYSDEYKNSVINTIGVGLLFRIWLLVGILTAINSWNCFILFSAFTIYSTITHLLSNNIVSFVFYYIMLICFTLSAIILTLNEFIFKFSIL